MQKLKIRKKKASVAAVKSKGDQPFKYSIHKK
jgi:hypothetical protein